MRILDLHGSKEFSPTHHVYKTLSETQYSAISVVGWEAGQISPIHSHPTCDEIYHVLEGEGLFNDGQEQRTLKPGDTVIFPAGEAEPTPCCFVNQTLPSGPAAMPTGPMLTTAVP